MKKIAALLAIGFVLTLTLSCAAKKPADVEAIPDDPEAGLSVKYLDGFVRNVDQMAPKGDFKRYGRTGKPIYRINNQFGNGEVFDSDRTRGIQVQMDGRILLDQKGTYRFRMLSNDGVRLYIDGEKVLEDPTVHGDRLSPIGEVNVEQKGWHLIRIRYFQRKGSAALKFYWQPPNAADFAIVPAIALKQPLTND